MSTKIIEAKRLIVCDACGAEGYTEHHGSRLIVERCAHDFQGAPCADATVRRDLCPVCTDVVVKAINEACEVCNGTQRTAIPADAVCYFMDGNKWCCVRGDFVNLQESPAGFGSTQEIAWHDLCNNTPEINP